MPRSCRARSGGPVRVQWSREDELGLDPKGPPQLIDISGAVSRRRPHSRLADRDVDSADDARAAEYSAAGGRGGRARTGARAQCRTDLAERRPALCGREHPGDRALAEGRAVAPGADPLARQAGQLLRGRELPRRACGRRRHRSGRVPAARPEGPARARGDQAHRRDDEMAAAHLARPATECRASRADAAFAYIHYKHSETYVAHRHGGRGRARERPHQGRAHRLRA